MIFEPGESYWVLTEEEYQEMLAFLEELELDYDLAKDFVQASDGSYYAYKDLVNDEEYSFLDDWGYLHNFLYNKSVQSTNPV